MTHRRQFLMSTEHECLTTVPREPGRTSEAVQKLLAMVSHYAPTLPGPSGIFNPYGRIYVDSSHIEIALVECDSPYLIPLILERQQALLARGVRALLERDKVHLVVANNNHSGLLTAHCPFWGAHENYLVEAHPSTFTDLILPFLVTRIYGGAGGVESPSGTFVAGVRPLAMQLKTGGGTTDHRAIHSTCREEHFLGPSHQSFRYHNLLGDGHVSSYSTAVQFGATALALKAVIHDPELKQQLARSQEFNASSDADWIKWLREINVLAKPGQPLRIHPAVVPTQRLYWEAARRFADTLENPPEWIPRLLADWDETLTAFERLDRAWLAARLDAFTKYEFYSAVLNDAGSSWSELPHRTDLFYELGLLDHSFHEFCNPDSTFRRLEAAGALSHRVGPRIEPGHEIEPWVPETTTRAAARARFLRDFKRRPGVIMDWHCVFSDNGGRCRELFDPFASEYGPWKRTTLGTIADQRRFVLELELLAE